jgi:23S rRNA (uridine2552-2'-O)-methyltransferase
MLTTSEKKGAVLVKRTASSRRWLQEHHSDPWVIRAQKEGWRSRAAFKLIEMLDDLPPLKQGMSVLDLGSSPGGWSQVLSRKLQGQVNILACDLLPMDPLIGVEFVLGDFSDPIFYQILESKLNAKVDLVISDMAPNLSGRKDVDLARMYYLAELALDCANAHLHAKGSLLIKVFQGEGFDVFLKEMRCKFSRVKILKPQASRARSSEIYLWGKSLK